MLLVGVQKGFDAPEKTKAIESVLKCEDLKTNLLTLSKFWKLKVWFNTEHDIKIHTHTTKKLNSDGQMSWCHGKSYEHTNVHVFSFISTATSGCLLYSTKRGHVRNGYYFPDLSTVTKYEVVLKEHVDEFKSYEQFKKKFDPFFIMESEIQNLWNGTSNQHGGKYKPSDFRSIGPQGKWVMERFLRGFKGITSTDHTSYPTVEPMMARPVYRERYKSNGHHFGRDISMEHRIGNPYVHYASEYPNCGNGRYGIVANKNQFLHLEDD